jgi:hypothetical protein
MSVELGLKDMVVERATLHSELESARRICGYAIECQRMCSVYQRR